jgi:ABC-type Na+ efflux pump permease subunit
MAPIRATGRSKASVYRTWVILTHTFFDAVVQPIFALLLIMAAAVMWVYETLPFFTLGEDTLMYKAVCLDIILLIVLLLSLFAASRSIYEEIEDRTMLTLMSKPVSRWQVLLGKFLGLLVAAGLAVTVLGLTLAVFLWLRIPGDHNLPADPIDEVMAGQLSGLRRMHLAGLWPQLVLLWMQVGVLIAISVTISTRFSLVVNVPATILFYVGGNLTRFVELAAEPEGALVRGLALALNTVLPFLAVFDLTEYTVYGTIALSGTDFAADPQSVSLSSIWGYVATAGLYFLAYLSFVLLLGYWSLRARELGGSEG